MNTIAIRADGNHQLGMGHIMRSLTLARALTSGHRRVEGHGPAPADGSALGVIFISKSYPEGLRKLEEIGLPIETVPVDISLEDEARFVIGIARKYNLKGIVLDRGSNSLDYVIALKRSGLIVWDFDDLGEGRFQADHVFDANLSHKENWLRDGSKTTFHLGTDFIVLDEAFARMRSAVRDRGPGIRGGQQADGRPISILVSMGGSDPANLTPKVLKTLVKMKEESRVTAVIGPAFRDVDSWAGGLAGRGGITFAKSVSNLADLLCSSDVAIVSGGITIFEASCMGVPAIVLCQNESQFKNAVKFHDCGAAINLGLGDHVSEEGLMGNLAVLIRDGELRATMSRNGMSYVDGRGLERVASIILSSFP